MRGGREAAGEGWGVDWAEERGRRRARVRMGRRRGSGKRMMVILMERS